MARKTAQALPPKTITVYAEILQETEKAILVRCDDESDGAWLPKGPIKYSGERGDMDVEIEIPELLASKKGFFDGMGRPAAPVEVAEPTPPCSACLESQNWPDMLSFKDGKIIFDENEPIILLPDSCRECLHWPYDHDVADDELTDNFNPDPDFREVDEAPAGKRIFGDNVKYLKEEKITVSQPLSDTEKARYAEEMAVLDREIEGLEDERAAVSSRLKKQIDAKEQERREMSAHVNDGELRTFSCDCLKDYNTGEMVWTEAYPPYKEVQRRKMTKEEMQPSLLEYSEKLSASAPAEEDGTTFDEGAGLDFDAVIDGEGQVSVDPVPSCGTCAHVHAVPVLDNGEVDSPCTECGGSDLPNYVPLEQAAQPEAGAVQ